ncbi:DEAD/DEAH box helicase [Bosea sp. CCNWLW174]|uniref:DEAD/DEAH box helicase n=1 Tax=unclassified Bosea (in: a-proteobacteria) TaxID=2653178 RepID=UPI0030147DEC
MRRQQLERILASEGLDLSGAFRKISAIGRYILEHGAAEGWLNQHIISLHAGVLDTPALEGLLPATQGLLREVGLFPYLESVELDWQDAVARESFRPVGRLASKYLFHREQAHAFDVLASGKNLVLSAPTSFGKSFLIDNLIDVRQPKSVVLVVPTLSLLDEQRRRLDKNFGHYYKIIYRNDQEVDINRGNILILTQERLRDRGDIDNIDLLIIDEFYKLNAKIDDTRSRCLNIIFSRYAPRAKQIFLLGPNIEYDVDLRKISAVRIDSHATTVATVIHDFSGETSKRKRLGGLLRERASEKSLVFCKSPASARQLADSLGHEGVGRRAPYCKRLGAWLAEHYHPDWIVARALEGGIGMHHGAMPRSVSQQVLRAFEDKDLEVLLCTSTLIEGVNTKAENVFIFDNKIRSTNFDYFSYKNISGRAGRFGRYMVGNVFIFNEAPDPEAYHLEIPSLSDPVDLSDDFLIGVDGFAHDESLRDRRVQLEEDLDLPADVIERLATFPISSIRLAAEAVKSKLQDNDQLVLWSGRVDYQELSTTLAMGWRPFAKGSSIVSGAQAAFYAFRMLGSGGRVRSYLNGIIAPLEKEVVQREIDRALKAIRDVDFYIPSVLSALQVLVNYYSPRFDRPSVDYSTMADIIESHYLPRHVKGLEEIGIPIPLGMKVQHYFSAAQDVDEAVSILRSIDDENYISNGLTEFECQMMRSSL